MPSNRECCEECGNELDSNDDCQTPDCPLNSAAIDAYDPPTHSDVVERAVCHSRYASAMATKYGG